MSKTIAVFGAGQGLGISVARRFGLAGHRVALVARRPEALDEVAGSLRAENIDVATFPTDLRDASSALKALDAIRDWSGSIDVLHYGPAGSDSGFVPARELNSGSLKPLVELLLLTPVEVINAVIPEMVARGDGAIVVVHGSSAIVPMPYLSGVGPVMAATRNYIHSLNAELAGTGVYAGTMAISAMVSGSAAHEAVMSGDIAIEMPDGATLPVVDPAELAELEFQMVTEREKVEVVRPPIPD